MAIYSGNSNDFRIDLRSGSPKEGPRIVPMSFDFSVNAVYTFDFQQIIAFKRLSQVQSVYIDNSANTQSVTLVINGTQQRVVCPGLSQGFFQIFVSGAASMTISSGGSVVVPVDWLNFEIETSIWSINPAATVTNGKLQVQDAALEAAINGAYLQTADFNIASGGVVKPNWKGDQAFTLLTSATGPTSVIAGQGIGIGWFIDNINVSLTPDAAISGGATEITITLTDTGTGTVWQTVAYIPAAAATPLTGNISLLRFDSIGYNSKISNESFTVTLSTALTSGKVIINGTWGTTSVIG